MASPLSKLQILFPMHFTELSETEVVQLMEYLRTSTFPIEVDNASKRKAYKKKVENFFIDADGALRINHRGYTPKFFSKQNDREKLRAVISVHEISGHIGRNGLLSIIHRYVYGVKRVEVEDVLVSCITCQRYKYRRVVNALRPIVATTPRERYIADLVDFSEYENSNDGYKYLLNIVDSFSKFVMAYPVKTKTAIEVCKCFDLCFSWFGEPRILHTDNGLEFCNQHLNGLCREKNIIRARGRPRTPRIQGQVERFNQTITNRLFSLALSLNNNDNWVSILHTAVGAYNRIIHSATNQVPMNLFMRFSGVHPTFTEEEARMHERSFMNEDGTIEHEESNSENDDLFERVAEHRTTYLERMVRPSRQQIENLDFSVGDHALLLRDFDNNRRTRRTPTTPYVDDHVYTITSIQDGNMAIIVSEATVRPITRRACVNRLRKVTTPDEIFEKYERLVN